MVSYMRGFFSVPHFMGQCLRRIITIARLNKTDEQLNVELKIPCCRRALVKSSKNNIFIREPDEFFLSLTLKRTNVNFT